MFIGENPSWDFGLRIPLESGTKSGNALNKNYLFPLNKNLGYKESDFWITNLFKCKYEKDLYSNKAQKQKEIFQIAKTCCLSWLQKEIYECRPKIIVTLGDKEVFQRFRKIFNLKIDGNFNKIAYTFHKIEIESVKSILIPACHPDISYENPRKKLASDKWSRIHSDRYIPTMIEALNDSLAE